MKRSAARKQRRETCEAIAKQEIDTLPWTFCKVEVSLYHRTKRRRDQDNAVSMLKSMYDGIIDAGVVPDDTPEYMERDWPKMLVDKNQPRMEVAIWRKK